MISFLLMKPSSIPASATRHNSNQQERTKSPFSCNQRTTTVSLHVFCKWFQNCQVMYQSGVSPYNCLSPSPHQHTDVCQYCNDLKINPHFLWTVNYKITHKLKPDIIFQIDTKSSELFYAILIADKRHLQFLLSCRWNSFALLI